MERLKTMLWIVAGVLFTVGLLGWVDRLAYGHLNMSGTGITPWGILVPSYVNWIGSSAGAFLISSLVYGLGIKRFESIGKIAVFTAMVTLVMALLSISADLGRMERAWRVVLQPNFRSPMAWMIWLYIPYFLLIVAENWLLNRRDLVRTSVRPGMAGMLSRILALGSTDTSDESVARDRRLVKVLALAGIPLAFAFHGGVGYLFSSVPARLHWHSLIVPPLFVVSALAGGGALLTVIAFVSDTLRRNRDTVIALGSVVLSFLLLDVAMQILEIVLARQSGVSSHFAGFRLTMFGPYWWAFWVIQIAAGTLIPIILLAHSSTRHQPAVVAFASLLMVVGFFAMRLNFVITGQEAEMLPGLAQGLRAAPYFPSLTAALIVANILGLFLIVMGLGIKAPFFRTQTIEK